MIEANRIDFHFLKMRINFSAFEKFIVFKIKLHFPLEEMEISFVKICKFKHFTPFYFDKNVFIIIFDILHIKLF